MKTCSECGKEKPLDQYDLKRGKPRSNCKVCVANYSKKHYLENKEYYLNKATLNRRIARRKLREFIFSYYRSHPCVVCGEADPMVLEFDHVKGKYKGIAIMVSRVLSLQRIKEEIDKCEVVCANCHKRRTAKQLGWYKDLI